MRIEFDTGEISTDEAMGLVMLLVSVHPALTAKIADLSGDVIVGMEPPAISRTLVGEVPEHLRVGDPDEVFTPPAEAAFAPPLAGSPAPGAAAPDGSSAPEALGAAPAAATPDISGVAVDGEGWPHDTRIHSETPTITTKGVWRARRFKTDADRKAAEATTHAELRAKGFGVPPATPPNPSVVSAARAPAASPVPAASSPPAPSNTPGATDGVATSPPALEATAEAASAAAAPAPPPVPAPPAMPAELAPSAPAPTAQTADTAVSPMVQFTGIMQAVTKAQGEGKITQDNVTGIIQGLGLQSMRELATRPDLMASFEATFHALIGA